MLGFYNETLLADSFKNSGLILQQPTTTPSSSLGVSAHTVNGYDRLLCESNDIYVTAGAQLTQRLTIH